jgi:tryptophan synthase alpha chain
VALIMLAAPTSGEARVAALAEATSGFLYVVSRLGITGGELHAGQELEAQLAMVRRHARTPVAVGFGVSRPEQAAALGPPTPTA